MASQQLPSTTTNVHNTFQAVSLFALSVLANMDTRLKVEYNDDGTERRDGEGNTVYVPNSSELDEWLRDERVSDTGVLKCLHATALPDGSPCADVQTAIGVVLGERQDSINRDIADAEKAKAEYDVIMARLKGKVDAFRPVTQAASPAPAGVAKGKRAVLTAL